MLELRNITKDYVSGNNVTHALKGISVNFRKKECVTILGQSGCGKTTTLNIIGCLDRYTTGNLLINGKSTKEYKDRDWDTYRNHSIGFVFQTYNLISHQNILKNVELALTISGVSKSERRQRAYDVLKIVGLEGMEKKKPNQLSGGQCQRVAIARALINNPEILLADEPTGALDSETSIQIMDLLKEVASDRLVIMVTHNPVLAHKYSTRIITMSDGLLTADTNPFDGKEEKTKGKPQKSEEKPVISKGKKKKTSMSLLTSMGLSLSNLVSKMKRTVLVTIAGSIGIIGVSAVLAASHGVKEYIKDLQNDMLSSYPISIAEESIDYTALITGLNNQDQREKFQFDPKNPKVGVDSMLSYLMNAYSDLTNVKTNTIDEKMLDFIDKMPKDNVGSIKYNYAIDPTNNIFGKWYDQRSETNNFYSFNGLTQRYIAELMTVEGFAEYANFVDLFTSFMGELPVEDDYIRDQYDVIAGDAYSTNEDDLVLVVDQDTTLTDIVLAQIGVFDHDSFINIAQCAMAEKNLKEDPEFEKKSQAEKDEAIKKVREENAYPRDFSYDELIGREFYYFPQDTIYSKDDHVADDKVTISLNFSILDAGNLDTFVTLSFQSYAGYNLLFGTAIQKDGSSYSTSTIACVNMELLQSNDPVDNKTDLKGTWYAFEPADLVGADMSNPMSLLTKVKFMFTVSDDAESISFKKNVMSMDPPIAIPSADATVEWTITPDPVTGYSYPAIMKDEWKNDLDTSKGMKMKISSILRLKESKNFGSLSRGLYFSKSFGDKYTKDSENATTVTKAMKEHINGKLTHTTEFNQAFVKFPYYDYKVNAMKNDGYASSLNGDLSSSFSDLFAGFTGLVDYSETNSVHFRSLSGYKAITVNNEEGEYDHTDFKHLPREISIYPKSFDAKDSITDYLDRWNSDEILTLNGEEYTKAQRDDLTYSDTISLIVSVIDTFINAITIALVVFTSLSLVVSCFMIAVITYISVVERIKEIGVIRSLGGRKGDVASLFIMENLMTGLFSGVFGIIMTYVLQIIVNAILVVKFGLAIIQLTIPTALMMIGISVGLSVLSGLIPSQSAAHKDPVVALRSNE